MGRPRKQVKRYACYLRENTYEDFHCYADQRGISYTFLTEAALLQYMSKYAPDSEVLDGVRSKSLKKAFGRAARVPYSCNLSLNTLEQLNAYAKNSGLKKTVLTDLAISEYIGNRQT